ncbi:MAG: succinate dehydrogenase iron-sulfur subunit [Nitrososphaerota archaeon]|jgi:succinate dehydrogenase / fumarate reductase iron-sulfur subunit|nr:succinate dehydrogenase iron-sulfur subunit [Nitrososphaerota archaeon]
MEKKNQENRNVTIRVRRFDAKEQLLKSSAFQVSANRFSTVLGELIGIKEAQDPSLSIRYSCRMGICGSCGMVINGKPRLACETNVFSLDTDEVIVEPMRGHPVLKDLVCDFGEFFDNHRKVMPWLMRNNMKEKFRNDVEHTQTRRQLDRFLPFSYCIKCGLCVDACPVVNTNSAFVGPQALAAVRRYNEDSRDQGIKQRLVAIDVKDGIWGCEYAGACSAVCPKGVDPALAIQLLKMDIMKRKFIGSNKSKE